VTGGGLRESQRESDRSILDLHLLPAFGHKYVKDITARDLDDYKAAKMQAKIVSTPKNKRARFHVIPRALADELRKFMLRTEDQLLFPDPRGGVLSNKVLNRWYRDLAKEAGVRRITSHGPRHTAGSSYAVMGAGQKVIGTLLGHSDNASTERYTHIAPSATTAMVEARWLRLGGGEGER
jgi:integrase